MPRLTPLTGLQSGLVAIMLSSVAIVGLEPGGIEASSVVQDEIAAPPNKNAMEKFMQQKLAAAQRALEGVAKEDFDQIKETTAEMIELSRQEAWERMASARFVQDTVDFKSAAEFLERMAEAKDSEGTTLGFVRLTMTCSNCHSHVRASSVAKADGALPLINREGLVLFAANPAD